MADTVRELIGVYDADGTLLGEARYWIGARLGRAHCALCDITHGLFTERADWRAAGINSTSNSGPTTAMTLPPTSSPWVHHRRSWSLAPIAVWWRCSAQPNSTRAPATSSSSTEH